MKTSFMKKYAAMLALLLFPAVNMNAQDEEITPAVKPTVFVEAYGKTGEEKAVRNAVMTALTNSRRMVLIDAESEAIANNEDIRRTGENVTAGSDMVAERMGAVVRLGAQYYLCITADNISHTTERVGQSVSANCKITLTAKAIDPSESKVLATSQMTFSGSNSKNIKDEAFKEALEQITDKGSILKQNPLLQFIEENFPITGQILEINDSKKDKAITVYINAGSDHGVIKGTKFEVLKEKKIGTRTAWEKIGELSAAEIQAEDLTLCKVTKGGDVIYTEINENGKTLKVRSRCKREVF